MKQTALALSHLVQTRYRHDALQIIGFNLAARRLTPGRARRGRARVGAGHQPPARADARVAAPAPPSRRRAGRARRHRRGADRAHRGATAGRPSTGRRPRRPLRATVAQVDELRRSGAQLNVFMLGDDPGLARFVDAVARRAGGRVFTPDIARLGGVRRRRLPPRPPRRALTTRQIGRSRWLPTVRVARMGRAHDARLDRIEAYYDCVPRAVATRRGGRALHALRRRRGHGVAVLRAAPAGRPATPSPPMTYAVCSSASAS